MPGKGAFYYINHHNLGTFLNLQIQLLTILKPVEVGKKFLGKMVKIKEMSFFFTRGIKLT